MGRGDNRRTPKMRRRAGQEKKKQSERKLRMMVAAKGSVPLPSNKPAATKTKTKVGAIKRAGKKQDDASRSAGVVSK